VSPATIARLRKARFSELFPYYVHLPKRYPRRHHRNLTRVVMAAAAQHQWRVAQLGERARARHTSECSMCRIRVQWSWYGSG